MGVPSLIAADSTITIDGASVKSIKPYALQGVTAQKLVLKNFTSLGDHALEGSNIKELELPATLTSVGNYAFANSAFESVSLPQTVLDSLAKATNLFDGAAKLTSVTLPAGITSIGNYWFRGTAKLNYQIPDSVTKIGTAAFQNSGTVSFTFKNGLTFPSTTTTEAKAITDAVFVGTALVNVTVENGVTSIPTYVFYGAGLKHISLPNTLTTIGKGAFSCSKLVEIVIPESVTSVASESFKFCEDLQVAVCFNSLSASLNDWFEECQNLKFLLLPNGTKGFSGSALTNCTSLNLYLPDFLSQSFTWNCFSGFTEEQTLYCAVDEITANATYGNFRTNTSGVNAGVPICNAKMQYNVTWEEYLEAVHAKELFDEVGLSSIWEKVKNYYNSAV